MDVALLESPTLRRSLCTRVEVLDRVKALVLLPDGLHVTTRMVGDYFEVGERTINSLVQRHRSELVSNGFKVIPRMENVQVSPGFTLKISPNGGRSTALYPRRAVLNVAMLLRDSEVARSVCRHLLEAEERDALRTGCPGHVDREARPVAVEDRILAGEAGDRLAACERMVLARGPCAGAGDERPPVCRGRRPAGAPRGHRRPPSRSRPAGSASGPRRWGLGGR